MSGSLTEVTVGAAYRNEFGLRNFVLELPPVGDVLVAVTGVVDLDVVARLGIELAEVRAAGRLLERDPVGDDRQAAWRVLRREGVDVGVVRRRVEHDAGRLAVRGAEDHRDDHCRGGQRGQERRADDTGSAHAGLLGVGRVPILTARRRSGYNFPCKSGLFATASQLRTSRGGLGQPSSAGSVNAIRVPPSGRGSAQIRPPWRSTTLLAIASPMPVPGYRRACAGAGTCRRSARRAAASIPMPLSSTVNRHPRPRARRDARPAARAPSAQELDARCRSGSGTAGESWRRRPRRSGSRPTRSPAARRRVRAHAAGDARDDARSRPARAGRSRAPGARVGEQVLDQRRACAPRRRRRSR